MSNVPINDTEALAAEIVRLVDGNHTVSFRVDLWMGHATQLARAYLQLRAECERLRAETMDDPFQCVDALANTVTETCNQYADAMKRWKAERDQLRAECERLRTDRDELAKMYERDVLKTPHTALLERIERDTAEQIAAFLESAEGNVARGMGVDHDVQTLQGYYYRRAAMVIRSMAWRTPGSDSRGGG